MSRNRKRIAKKAGDRQIMVSGQSGEGKGLYHPLGVLSWYFDQPRVEGPSYVLTEKGYVVLSTGLPKGWKRVDTNELLV